MRWQESLETEIDRSNGQAHGGGRGVSTHEDIEGPFTQKEGLNTLQRGMR